MAYKCSAIQIDGVWKDVFKDPVTDSGKRSKKGRLVLMKNKDGDFVTVKTDDINPFAAVYGTYLETYYENGEILVDDNLKSIRERLALTYSK